LLLLVLGCVYGVEWVQGHCHYLVVAQVVLLVLGVYLVLMHFCILLRVVMIGRVLGEGAEV
jgi:hypothetical protein